MFKAYAIAETDILDAVQETARQAPAQLRRELGKIARGKTAQALIRDLSKEPPAPDYPIKWTSDRQRRFVMAKLRRENNLPYARSHSLSRGWRVVLDYSGGVYSVENSNPATQFVQGEFQQRFLAKWPLARLIIRQYQPAFEDETITAWVRVVDSIGGRK